MMFLYLFMRVMHARAENVCVNGRAIETEVLTDVTKAIGDWSLVQDWDRLTVYPEKYIHYHHSYCPAFRITKSTTEDVERFKASCEYANPKFNWDKVKLKITSPDVIRYDRLVAEGVTDNFVLERCLVTPIVLRRVGAKQLLMIYPDIANVTLLLSKRIPKEEELHCLNDNIDVVKNLNGVSFCYK